MNIEKELDRISDDEKNSIAIDFDGVIHRNSKGFHDGTIYDDPIEGTEESLKRLSEKYTLILYTTKAKPDRGLINGRPTIELIWEWLDKYDLKEYINPGGGGGGRLARCAACQPLRQRARAER